MNDKGLVLHFLIKRVYGVFRAYPQNEWAQQLCNLLKVKTLTKKQIKDFKEIGVKFKLESEYDQEFKNLNDSEFE